MYFAVFCLQVGHEAVPGRYLIPSASFHSWACGSASKRGLGCKTGGYSAKLAHLPGYGVTPILGQNPPHNNIIPPPTPAVYWPYHICWAWYWITTKRFQVIQFQMLNCMHALVALGDRFWLFIQTLNNDKRSFNSIFNSKTKSNYSFKNKIKLFIQRIYSFKKNIKLCIQRVDSFNLEKAIQN